MSSPLPKCRLLGWDFLFLEESVQTLQLAWRNMNRIACQDAGHISERFADVDSTAINCVLEYILRVCRVSAQLDTIEA